MKFCHRWLTAGASAGFILAFALIPTGCGSSPPPTPPPPAGGQGGSGNWEIPLKEWKPEAGLDQAQAGYVSWMDPTNPISGRSLACVILSDVVGSQRTTATSRLVSGEHGAFDGRKVEWQC